MPTRGCGMDDCRGVGQTPCIVHLCPAVLDDGGKCGEQITLPAIYRSGDPQVNVECPNSKGLRPHKFTIFTVANPAAPELDGTFQTLASADFPV